MSGTNETYNILTEAKCLYNSEHTRKTRKVTSKYHQN